MSRTSPERLMCFQFTPCVYGVIVLRCFLSNFPEVQRKCLLSYINTWEITPPWKFKKQNPLLLGTGILENYYQRFFYQRKTNLRDFIAELRLSLYYRLKELRIVFYALFLCGRYFFLRVYVGLHFHNFVWETSSLSFCAFLRFLFWIKTLSLFKKVLPCNFDLIL